MKMLENITYEELSVGDHATFTKTLTEEELVLFAASTGDVNPVNLDPEYAKKHLFKERIGHGMWTGSLISGALATVIPGPGTIHLEQNLKFKHPVMLDDTLTVRLTVTEKLERNRVLLECIVINQDKDVVVEGLAKVIAPIEKVTMDEPELPRITVG